MTLEFQGIDHERVERMETRLKEDILREAERYGGAIMVIHEMDDGQIFDAWEHVTFEAVQTPLEVYRCLEAEGLPIKFARVPITDGKAPKSSDFDTLAMNVASSSKDTAFVFNCQVGVPYIMKLASCIDANTSGNLSRFWTSSITYFDLVIILTDG